MTNVLGSDAGRVCIWSFVVTVGVMLIVSLIGEDQASLAFQNSASKTSAAIRLGANSIQKSFVYPVTASDDHNFAKSFSGDFATNVDPESQHASATFISVGYLFVPYIICLAMLTLLLRVVKINSWSPIIFVSSLLFLAMDFLALELFNAYISILLLPLTIAAVALCYAIEEHYRLRAFVIEIIQQHKEGFRAPTEIFDRTSIEPLFENPTRVLESSRLTHEQFFNKLPVGFIAINRENIVIRANQFANTFLCNETETLIGKIFQPELFIRVNPTLAATQCEGPTAYQAQTAEGRHVWVMDQNVDEDVALSIERVIAFIDIGKLAESSVDQENIAQYFYHDLRAPLAAIASIATNPIAPSPQEIDRMRTFALRAIDISEQLLLHARMSRSTLMSNTSISVYDLATQLEDEVNAKYCSKNIRIELDLPKVPGLVADYSLIFRALMNLLDNAAQHSPCGGSINLRVAFQHDQWVFSVTDNGIGLNKVVPKQANPHSFGLGLKFVRKVAALYGGSLSISNKLNGNGAIATFTLNVTNSKPLPHVANNYAALQVGIAA
jgi:signal transduction histidine kinase